MAPCGPPLHFGARAVFGELFQFDSKPHQDAYYAAAKDLRVKVIRVGPDWSLIQPNSQTFLWAGPSGTGGWDDMVRRMHDIGCDIICTIGPEVPDWANSGAGSHFPPNELSVMSDWVTTLVRRYKPGGEWAQENGITDGWGIRVWEFWNEPNLGIFWQPTPNPYNYAPYLKAAYIAAKAEDPNCVMAMGGLSRDGVPVGQYTQALYNAGIKGYLDYLGVHPFTTDPLSSLFTGPILAMLNAADQAGDVGRRMLITEFQIIGQQAQATALPKFYQQLYNSALRLSCCCWSTLRDTQVEFSGLVYFDGSPKPLTYNIFKNDLPDGVGPA